MPVKSITGVITDAPAPTTNTVIDGVPVQDFPSDSQEQALALYDPNQGQGQLSFLGDFASNPQALAHLKEEARTVGPKMRVSSDAFLVYGTDATADVSAQSKEILRVTGDIQAPEVKDPMRALKKSLTTAQTYDVSVAANKARYDRALAIREKRSSGLMGRLSSSLSDVKDYWEQFFENRKTLEQQIEEVAADLQGRSMDRAKAANMSVALYRKNELMLGLLSERLAVMELILQDAEAEFASMPNGKGAGDPETEAKNNLQDFINLLKLKIDEFTGIYLTGCATAPMLRAQKTQHVMMAFKLQMMATTGMDKTRLVLAQYNLLLGLQEDVKAAENYAAYDNQITQDFFRNAAASLPEIARLSRKATQTEETVTVMTESVIAMLDGLAAADVEAEAERQRMMGVKANALEILSAKSGEGLDHNKLAAVVSGSQAKSITGTVS